MSVFLDSSARIVVQGMTGSEGRKHTRLMLGAGTNVVGGTNPKKAGQTSPWERPQKRKAFKPEQFRCRFLAP